MSADDLWLHLRRRPFVPFTIVTTSEERHEIRHPEFVVPFRRTVMIGIPQQPGDTTPETAVWLSFLHVQRVEVQEPAET